MATAIEDRTVNADSLKRPSTGMAARVNTEEAFADGTAAVSDCRHCSNRIYLRGELWWHVLSGHMHCFETKPYLAAPTENVQ